MNKSILSSPGYLARWPIIGACLFILGLLAFGALTYNVKTNGPLLQYDLPIDQALHQDALASPRWLVQLMVASSFMGREMVVLLSIGLGLYFFYRRYWREFAMVVIGAGGGEVWFELISRLVDRHRPVFAKAVFEVLPGPGFPSGHCISAIVVYGLIVYLLVPHLKSRFWKTVVILAWAVIALLIGFSRIFVGDHYLTDVLAGYAFGFAWAGLVYTTIDWIASRRQKESRSKKAASFASK